MGHAAPAVTIKLIQRADCQQGNRCLFHDAFSIVSAASGEVNYCIVTDF
jgi:hypothetical protein